MSQASVQQPQFVVMQAPERGNGLGAFGLLVSIVGLIVPTGIVALLGLMLSLVALGRPPRGLASVGVMVGLLGTVAWLVVDLLVVLAAIVGLVGVGLAGSVAFVTLQPEVVEVTRDMVRMAVAVDEHAREHEAMPETIDALSIGRSTAIDPWGKPYRLELADRDPGFDIASGGPDRAFGTGDDIRMTSLDRTWEIAFEAFGLQMERLGDQMGVECSGCQVERGDAEDLELVIAPGRRGYEARARRSLRRDSASAGRHRSAKVAAE